MKNGIKRTHILLYIIYFTRYFACGLFSSFFSLYLAYKGLSESLIGKIYSMQTAVTLLILPIFSLLSRSTNKTRNILRVLMILEGLALFLFRIVNGFELLALASVVFTATSVPSGSLLDGFSSSYSKAYNKDYQLLRSIGSLSYFISTLVGGFIIVYFNYEVMIVISTIICLIGSVFINFTISLPMEIKDNETPVKFIGKVFKNKSYIFYIVLIILITTFLGAAANYNSLFLTQTYSLDAKQYGYIGAFLVFVEFLFILLSKKIFKKVNPIYGIFASSIIHIIKLFVYSLNPPLPVSVAATLIQGIANGLQIGLMVECVINILGPSYVTSGLLIQSVCTTVARIFIDMFMGDVIENTSYFVFYRYFSLIMIAVVLIAYIAYEILRKYKVISFTQNINKENIDEH